MSRVTLVVLGVLSLGCPAFLHAAAFSDGFEGSGVDPFWQSIALSGSMAASSEQVHSGTQSLKFTSTMAGGQKDVGLRHEFAQPTYGTFSVWLYDAGAGDFSGNYVSLHMTPQGNLTGWGVRLFGNNGATQPNTSYLGTAPDGLLAGPDFDTGVLRSKSWHQLQIASLPDSLTFSVDGQVVHTSPATAPFTEVIFEMYAASFDPASTSYWDDFQFTPIPEPGMLAPIFLLMLPLLRPSRRS